MMNPSELENNLLGELLDELNSRHRRGEDPRLDEVCHAHPQFADQLRELFSTLCVIEKHRPSKPSQPEPAASTISHDKDTFIGGYKILREVARGGMGVVYEAIQLSLGRHVALKIISSHLIGNELAIERFRREARLASQLHHSNIVPVFDVGSENNICFYAMQYIPGQSLDNVIDELRILPERSPRKYSPIATTALENPNGATAVFQSQEVNTPMVEVLRQPLQSADTTKATPKNIFSPEFFRNTGRIGVQIADALAYAHGKGILHRDIKPSNILVDANGNAWVTDFGLAKIDETSTLPNQAALTEAGDIVGTLRYLAPERLRGQHDQRCDIYSLAATLYEMLALRPIFESVDRVHLMDLLKNTEPVSLRALNPMIPRDLETIVLKGLSKQRENRYQTAQSMADDLRLFLLDRPIQARRTSFVEKGIRWCLRNRITATLAAVLLLSLTALTVGFLINRAVQRQRDEAIVLYQQTDKARNEAKIRALLNDVSAHRLTQGPELTPLMEKLRQLPKEGLAEDLIVALRNETASCLLRDDWYLSEERIPISYPLATLTRNRKSMAFVDSSARLCLSSFPMRANSTQVIDVGFTPDSLRFSREGDYLVAKSGASHQIVRRKTGTTVHSGVQIVMGCDVCDFSHRAAYWHADNRISVEEISEANPGKLVMDYRTENPVSVCRLNPKGDLVAFSQLGSVVVLRIPNGEIFATFSLDGVLTRALEWSPDGQLLALADESSIRVWNVADNALVSVFPTDGEIVWAIDWNSSSNLIAFQTWGLRLKVFNAHSGRLLVNSTVGLTTINFSNDGKTIGWTIRDGILQFLEWRSGLLNDLTLSAHDEPEILQSISYHPNLPIAVACATESASIINTSTMRKIGTIPVFEPIACEFGSKGDEFVVLGSSAIQRWPFVYCSSAQLIELGPPKIQETQGLTSGFIAPELNAAIAATVDGALVELDLDAGTVRNHRGSSLGLSVKRLCKSDYCAIYDWKSPIVEIRNFITGDVIGRIESSEGSQVFANPDLTEIVTCDTVEIRFWEFPGLTPSPQKPPISNSVVEAKVTFDSSGKEVLIQSSPHTVTIASSSALTPICSMTLMQPVGPVISLNFDPSGRYLFGRGGKNLVHGLDLASLLNELAVAGLDWPRAEGASGLFPAIKEPELTLQIRSGDINSNEMKSKSALAEAEAGHRMAPYNPTALNNLAWQLIIAPRKGADYAKAEALARQAYAQDPGPIVRNTLGLALYRNGKFEEAKSYLIENLKSQAPDQLAFDLVILALIEKAQSNQESSIQFETWLNRNIQSTPLPSKREKAELKLLLNELQELKKPETK
ncbi:MAG: protein kinase [Pirellulaceae bacterium]